MNIKLEQMKNKVVLVTGGSRGIGFAVAQEFVATGAKVLVIHNDPKVKVMGRDIREFFADVSDESQVKSVISKIISEFKRIDILVNNAAIAIDKNFEDRTVSDWRHTLNVNLIGVFLVSKYVGKIMMKNKSGKIVNVASTNGIDSVSPYSLDYDASKAGIINLTKNLAIQFAPYVNVNSVAPGWVNTDMNTDLPADYMADEMKKVALGRIAEPHEIAKIIAFLASNAASYVNGTTIVANGGQR